jgi:hypothetical protein
MGKKGYFDPPSVLGDPNASGSLPFFKRELKMEEDSMKLVVLFVMAVFMFVAADAAFALGGGGHHGDGRLDALQQVGKSNSDTNGTSGNTQNGSNGSTGDSNGSFTLNQLNGVNSVPEPLGLLLLGLSVIGLAGIRRRVKQ